MAEKLGLVNETRLIKIGRSFTDANHTAFHTVKYDFKPASLDSSKTAAIEIGNNNSVALTAPHADGSAFKKTSYQGSQRPYVRECVLIIDKVTGEITLEKLSSNIQIKKAKSELRLPNDDHFGTTNHFGETNDVKSKTVSSPGLSELQTLPVAQCKRKIATNHIQKRPVKAKKQKSQQDLLKKCQKVYASTTNRQVSMHT